MRIRKLAIAALIAAVPTATAFSQNALDQSMPRMSPTNGPRVSPTNEPHVSAEIPLPTNPGAISEPPVIVPPAPANPYVVEPRAIPPPAAR
jgi:hypothetical protein